MFTTIVIPESCTNEKTYSDSEDDENSDYEDTEEYEESMINDLDKHYVCDITTTARIEHEDEKSKNIENEHDHDHDHESNHMEQMENINDISCKEIEIDGLEEEQTITELVETSSLQNGQIMEMQNSNHMRVAFGIILRLVLPLANGVVRRIQSIRDARFLRVLQGIASSRQALTNLLAFTANTISMNLSSVQVSHRLEPILKLMKIRKSRDGLESLPDTPGAGDLTTPSTPSTPTTPNSPIPTALYTPLLRSPKGSTLPNFGAKKLKATPPEQPAPKCCDLKILAEPPPGQPIRADIIFIHGLHGSLVNTWKQGLWENDRRPVEFPRPPKPPVRPPKRARHSRSTHIRPPHKQKRARLHHLEELYRQSLDSEMHDEKNDFTYICGEPQDIKICDGIEYSFPTFRIRMNDSGRLLQAEIKTIINEENSTNENEKQDNSTAAKDEKSTKSKTKAKPKITPNDPNYSKCWPGDWLPLDCPGVRVIAVNYTTDQYLWRPLWKKKEPRTNLIQRSREMAELLIEQRVGYGHPIVWVGHSKGGLFVKQIIVDAWESGRPAMAPFWRSARGCFFYSVPHRGSHLASIKAPLLTRSVELLDIEKKMVFPHQIVYSKELEDLQRNQYQQNTNQNAIVDNYYDARNCNYLPSTYFNNGQQHEGFQHNFQRMQGSIFENSNQCLNLGVSTNGMTMSGGSGGGGSGVAGVGCFGDGLHISSVHANYIAQIDQMRPIIDNQHGNYIDAQYTFENENFLTKLSFPSKNNGNHHLFNYQNNDNNVVGDIQKLDKFVLNDPVEFPTLLTASRSKNKKRIISKKRNLNLQNQQNFNNNYDDNDNGNDNDNQETPIFVNILDDDKNDIKELDLQENSESSEHLQNGNESSTSIQDQPYFVSNNNQHNYYDCRNKTRKFQQLQPQQYQVEDYQPRRLYYRKQYRNNYSNINNNNNAQTLHYERQNKRKYFQPTHYQRSNPYYVRHQYRSMQQQQQQHQHQHHIQEQQSEINNFQCQQINSYHHHNNKQAYSTQNLTNFQQPPPNYQIPMFTNQVAILHEQKPTTSTKNQTDMENINQKFKNLQLVEDLSRMQELKNVSSTNVAISPNTKLAITEEIQLKPKFETNQSSTDNRTQQLSAIFQKEILNCLSKDEEVAKLMPDETTKPQQLINKLQSKQSIENINGYYQLQISKQYPQMPSTSTPISSIKFGSLPQSSHQRYPIIDAADVNNFLANYEQRIKNIKKECIKQVHQTLNVPSSTAHQTTLQSPTMIQAKTSNSTTLQSSTSIPATLQSSTLQPSKTLPQTTLHLKLPTKKRANLKRQILNDPFGMAGLASAMKGAKSDRHLEKMLYGLDLEDLNPLRKGFSSNEMFLPYFRGPFFGEIGEEQENLPLEVETVNISNNSKNADSMYPRNLYHLSETVRRSLTPPKMTILSDEQLFYIFYTQIDSKYLLDLHRRFAGLYHLGHLQVEVFSFVETALTLMSVLYLRIVGADSADPGFGDVCGIRLDHREICKPRSRDCILYKELVKMIKKVC